MANIKYKELQGKVRSGSCTLVKCYPQGRELL